MLFQDFLQWVVYAAETEAKVRVDGNEIIQAHETEGLRQTHTSSPDNAGTVFSRVLSALAISCHL